MTKISIKWTENIQEVDHLVYGSPGSGTFTPVFRDETVQKVCPWMHECPPENVKSEVEKAKHYVRTEPSNRPYTDTITVEVEE